MCGIVGKVVRQNIELDLSDRKKAQAIAAIRHRGPDMRGEYSYGSIWLAHVRLSILDLSDAASQPMATENSRYVISYNGEVYNFRELADSLSLDSLRSHSDTEVVLRTFAKLGVNALPRLNGMFAFALYDKQGQKLWLVRDRLGIKPLYYRFDEAGLSFGSEIKALLAMDGESPQCDLLSLHEWLYYGSSLGEHTLYKGIHKLLPGHYLELNVSSFGWRIEKYWGPKEYAGSAKFDGSVEDRIHQTRNLLEQAVKRQLVSDVPVGIFLSGGIDSSAITAFASKHYGGRIATYSAGFDFDKGVNELLKARRVAEFYGTEHHEIHISGFAIADVVEKMVHQHDMPFSDAANMPLYLLSSRIKDTTKVVLQGDGGDEMFGGYSRYTTLSFYKTARVLAKLGRLANYLTPRNAQLYRRQRYINALAPDDPVKVMALLLTEEDGYSNPAAIFAPEIRRQIMEADPFARYRECQSYFTGEDLVNQMLLVDAMIILPDIFLEKVDRATMAASVEARVPFLDNDLVDFCMQLSGPQKVRFGRKKWLLKKALEGTVPHDVLYGKKTGFGVPYGYWLRGVLKPLFFGQLQLFDKRQPGVLDEITIHALYDEHVSRRRDRSFLLWKLLNFLIWANQTRVCFTS
jgi:asparagine synthase (glutamine-hydrolysing)